MYYVNEHIKECIRIFPEQGRGEFIRLDMNENPEGLPLDFVNSVLDEITPSFLATYPEPKNFMEKYANALNVSIDNVCCVNGSDMGIRYIFDVFTHPGGEAVMVSPTFGMYGVNAKQHGVIVKSVQYDDNLTVSAEKIVDSITDNTNLVILLNPNNPVGNVFTNEECNLIIEKARLCNAVVVIDEAYHYFCPETFLDFVQKYDNVLLLRTFSKLFSLAAVRLGVIIGNESIIRYVQNARLSFDVNSIALKFGERLLDSPGIKDDLIQIHRQGKEYLIDRLKSNDIHFFAGKGNFLFVEPTIPAPQMVEELYKRKILVKYYEHPLLNRYIRVTTASQRMMSLFWNAFEDIQITNR